MAILTDFHTHSHFSGDCDTPLEDMISRAVSLGMSHLCLTEHFDPDYPVKEGENLNFHLDTENYRKDFLSFQDKYKDKIQLLWGVELGLQDHLFEFLDAYTKKHPFDFILASSHLCNGEDPYYPEFFFGKDEEQVYLEYFSGILKNVQNSEPNISFSFPLSGIIIAHSRFCVKFRCMFCAVFYQNKTFACENVRIGYCISAFFTIQLQIRVIDFHQTFHQNQRRYFSCM